jgi:hypothetical protein
MLQYTFSDHGLFLSMDFCDFCNFDVRLLCHVRISWVKKPTNPWVCGVLLCLTSCNFYVMWRNTKCHNYVL